MREDDWGSGGETAYKRTAKRTVFKRRFGMPASGRQMEEKGELHP
jgi:hypothetical protein